MGQGEGFGKVILFGEHFVVYGLPAIASGVKSTTTATVTKRTQSGWSIKDDRNAIPGYKEGYAKQQAESIDRMMAMMRIDLLSQGVDIHLGGDLKVAGGIGASAASCAAIARAFSDEFGLGLTDEQINELALEGDKAYAGNPSGIDNTAAVYGDLIWFVKEPKTIELMQLPKPLGIVMGNTGVVANTKVAVAGVKERKEKEPERYEKLFAEYKELSGKAKEALLAYDIDKIAVLIDENHRLLQEIEVSNEALDDMCAIAKKNGALAAKMTGGGLGGYMYALTPDSASQKSVVAAMKKAGYDAFATNIGQ